MSQLSFFSAEAVPPAVADLTGLLAAPGQVLVVGSGPDGPKGARISVVVDRAWRAEALAALIGVSLWSSIRWNRNTRAAGE